MADPIGMGVVGAGAIGIRGALRHLSQPDVQDKVRLAAVCDPVEGRAEAAAAEYGVAAHYMGLEELLADQGVDAVTLCSPIGLHFDQGMAALEAGKHIHFNKTMTTTVDEADRILQRAAEKDLRVVASPGMMLHPHNRRIRRHILQGDLGQLVWAAAGVSISDYHMNEEFRTGDSVLTNVDPSWYFRKPGGGPQYDVTVYALHNLTGLLGPAKRVTALSGLVLPEREFRGRSIPCDMDDSTMILVDFGAAFFAFVYGTVAGSVTQGFQPSIYGTAGAVVGTKLGEEEMQRADEHQPHVSGPHINLAESHVFEDMMQLVDWVRDGTPSIVTIEHARHVVDIIESGYRAAETGQAQELRTTFAALGLEQL
ncbi:MAG: gfo/Idh/MocA family oxidoreductase [Candidatus Latescibacteria bacterium]|nr:gfo/Idh/MocA family oxidoreductase [Candidatus Latescibacterota bacterium]